ncbi:MAG: transcriptional regulator [Frankiales bacterium]|jgi:two-component system OmpR family response regulator|nr:transcriptional regulator [Frankiales bacterium]MCW2706710.1 transcriptional regulator [Frankiales bacterium]
MRVLLVEDEEHLAQAVQRGLAAESFRVEVAHDGPTGLSKALSGEFDVVVLDIMLPGLSGYRICQEMRRQKVWTPVLMLTAKDGEYDEADALDLGADDYLTKPFSFVVLVARLRSLVRRGAPARPVVLEIGDLAIDPARHTVTVAGEKVALTPREFALLLFLMRHPEAVQSKREILDSVWDAHYDGDPNIVEVYVGYLRKKLAAGATRIETVRGVGYVLTAPARI